METEFFERQESKDCTVHSLNNAVGRRAMVAADVVRYVDEQAAAFAFSRGGLPLDHPDVVAYRDGLADGETFFSAQVAWDAAVYRGALRRRPRAVPVDAAAAGAYPAVVYLGVRSDGAYHAVASRGKRLYDSLAERPQDLSPGSLAETYKSVFGAYALI